MTDNDFLTIEVSIHEAWPNHFERADLDAVRRWLEEDRGNAAELRLRIALIRDSLAAPPSAEQLAALIRRPEVAVASIWERMRRRIDALDDATRRQLFSEAVQELSKEMPCMQRHLGAATKPTRLILTRMFHLLIQTEVLV